MPLILFDVDMTLIKSDQAHLLSFHDAFKTVFDIDTTIDVIQPSGMTDWQIIVGVMRYHRVKDETINAKLTQCMDVMNTRYEIYARSGKIEVLSGVQTTLELLARHHVTLGLVTGNLQPIAWRKMENAGLAQFFCCGGFGSDACERYKLVDFARDRATKLNQYLPGDAIHVVGDTPRDVEAAQQAGVHSIAVATGNYSVDDLKQCGADLVLEDLTHGMELLKTIQSIP